MLTFSGIGRGDCEEILHQWGWVVSAVEPVG
jgi:hypothetical protein